MSKIVLPRKRYSKYRAKRCERINPDGSIEKYASQKEMKRHQELLLLEKAGKIRDLKREVPFILAPSITINGEKVPALRYVADFTYLNLKGELVVNDAKGYLTPVYRIKRHLMQSTLGISILET
jgi:hypothetical protein